MLKLLAISSIVLLAIGVGSVSAAPIPVQIVFQSTGTYANAVTCVSERQILRLAGETRHSVMLYGLTDVREKRIWFDTRSVCDPVGRYERTGYLTNWAVDGLITIGHEAAHLRHVRSERKAECLGVRFAYNFMRQHGTFVTYAKGPIRAQLLDDSYRSPAYKLHGTCTL